MASRAQTARSSGPTEDRSVLTEILPPEERAIEQVVARYQRVSGAVTRFARTLAGNDELNVRIGADAESSEDEVVVDPALFQAAYARRAPVTPDEVALASALHEVVHLVSTDLDEPRELPRDWFGEGREAPEGEFDLLDGVRRAGGTAAEGLFFATEDARQERQGLAAYPGARSVLTDLYHSALPRALAEATMLGQFTVACFMLLGGHLDRDTLERRVHAKVAGALPDAQPFLDAAAEADDPWDIGTVALQLLSVARLHGIVDLDQRAGETSAQRSQREEDESAAATANLDRLRLATPVLADRESYEQVRSSGQPRSAESFRRGASKVASQEATDQLIRVSTAPTVHLPTGQGGRLIVSAFPTAFADLAGEGRATMAQLSKRWNLTQRHVTGELYPLFAANQRRGLQSGFDSGDLSPHAPLLLAGGLYDRMYERRALRTRRSYAVSLLVDGSASMLQQREGSVARDTRWGMPAAALGAWMLASLCEELQVDFEVAVFNRGFAATADDTEASYRRRRGNAISELRRAHGSHANRLTQTVNHYLLKPFDRRWRATEPLFAGFFHTITRQGEAAQRARRDADTAPPMSMFEKAANVDEFNVRHAADRLERLGAAVRVLVVLADGMTRGSLTALARTTAQVEESGTMVLGIGIGDDTVTRTYHRHVVVDRPDALTSAMVDGVRSALRRSLAMSGLDAWWVRGAAAGTPTSPMRRTA
ncbi:MAG: hypothetical protein AB1Z57_09590 [Acidimicrobiia bacterium]